MRLIAGGRFGDMPDFVELLIEKIRQTQNADVREHLILELGRTRDDRAITPLLRCLFEGDGRSREAAIQGLVEIGAPAIPHLMEHSHSPDTRARLLVVKTLGAIRHRSAADHLIRMLMLDESNPDVQCAIVDAIDAIGEQDRAVDAMIVLLKGAPSGPRWRAALSLSRSADARAIGELARAAASAADNDLELAWVARYAIERIAEKHKNLNTQQMSIVNDLRRQSLMTRAAGAKEMPAARKASPPRSSLAITHLNVNDETVVSLKGELFFNTIETFDEYVQEILDSQPRAIILNFAECSFIDSIALSRLNVIRNKLKAGNCAFRLQGLAPAMKKIFETTKLDLIFDII